MVAAMIVFINFVPMRACMVSTPHLSGVNATTVAGSRSGFHVGGSFLACYAAKLVNASTVSPVSFGIKRLLRFLLSAPLLAAGEASGPPRARIRYRIASASSRQCRTN
jgi:hypothetical protein